MQINNQLAVFLFNDTSKHENDQPPVKKFVLLQLHEHGMLMFSAKLNIEMHNYDK